MSMLSRLARLLGWNPIGTVVNIIINESSNSEIVGTELTATVASIKENGAFVLRLATVLMQGGKPIQEVLAYPRHKGYDIYHIAFSSIAVYLAPCVSNESDPRFASALVKHHKP